MIWCTSLSWVLAYHAEVARLHGIPANLLGSEGRGRLESALHRARATAFGEDIHKGLAEKGAALLQGIVTAHSFSDGNKRVALGTLLSFLQLNGVDVFNTDEPELYDLVLAVTIGEVRDVASIASWVERLFPGVSH